MDMDMQVQATRAVNDMYNFKFEKAENEFRWFQLKYPDHPLPYFLLGLSEWWKIVPNIDNQQFDSKFYAYMDTSIILAERMYRENNKNIEASFFLAAAYGSGRGVCILNARTGGKQLSTPESHSVTSTKVRGYEELSPEFLFGDALYNYYRDWVPENYPALKTILWLFPEGRQGTGNQAIAGSVQQCFLYPHRGTVFSDAHLQ